jgi:UDP-N-acetyl-D-glucosamine dehydrogenase
VKDVSRAALRPLLENGRLKTTTDFSAVMAFDTINIAVPTPLRKTKDPDMSYILNVRC